MKKILINLLVAIFPNIAALLCLSITKPAYFVAMYNISNEALFKEYQAFAIPMLKKYRCKVLTLGLRIVDNIVEGKRFQMTVVIWFASAEEARRWYRSSEYQEPLKMRLNSTFEASACIVEAL